MTLHAITRAPSPAIAECELTHLERVPIDPERAAAEHEEYERALASLGCTVEPLPAEADLPDSVFVEDTALVLPELAVITRPGAASRRPEIDSVAAALGRYRELAWIVEPGTMDGGDVLQVGRRIHVGLSERTNAEAADQLRAIVEPRGYEVTTVAVHGCLHLKSAVSWLGEDRLLLNPDWIDVDQFGEMKQIAVDPAEPRAANVLRIDSTLIAAAGHERTHARLESGGFHVLPVDITELAKAEAGVTCSSLILDPG